MSFTILCEASFLIMVRFPHPLALRGLSAGPLGGHYALAKPHALEHASVDGLSARFGLAPVSVDHRACNLGVLRPGCSRAHGGHALRPLCRRCALCPLGPSLNLPDRWDLSVTQESKLSIENMDHRARNSMSLGCAQPGESLAGQDQATTDEAARRMTVCMSQMKLPQV